MRQQQIIEKDLECERKFEGATNYLFEKMLYHKPLQLIGTAHPDGTLSYQVQNQVTISLITAKELKDVAEQWHKNSDGKQEDPFPLGYLIQPGRFNPALVPVS